MIKDMLTVPSNSQNFCLQSWILYKQPPLIIFNFTYDSFF